MIIARQRLGKLSSIIIHVKYHWAEPWILMAMLAHLVASLAGICKGTSRPVGLYVHDRGAAGQQRNFWIAPPLCEFFCAPAGLWLVGFGDPHIRPPLPPPRIAIKTSTPPPISSSSPSFSFVGIPDSSNLLPLQCVPVLPKRPPLPSSII